ncbi:unnamed protein product [Meloidogyne enterolobii]|uniref:Uncharacterized protein n=1 Tax=Meloidogyne enterolobii TaxID=390850 RepID=A0ACB0Z1Q8_MELEN
MGNYGRLRVQALPNLKFLGKTNTKLFISHCDLNSLNEAMYAGVPLICIPYAADEFYNASLVEHLGIGIYVHLGEGFAEALRGALKSILVDNFR